MLEIGERPWGKYYVLADEAAYKLKRILANDYHINIIITDRNSGLLCRVKPW